MFLKFILFIFVTRKKSKYYLFYEIVFHHSNYNSCPYLCLNG